MKLKIFGRVAVLGLLNLAASGNFINKTSPKGFDLHGIDVSRYQSHINWSKVSSSTDNKSIQFAFIKATEGTSLGDPHFASNWKKANEKDITVGAYMYFHPNKSGQSQANNFIKKVALVKGHFAPVVDIETTDSVDVYTLRSRLQTCLNTLEKKYGVKPIIYTSSGFYKSYLGSKFDKYPLWVAQYKSTTPNVKRKWHIWQHTDKGKVNGISGNVDMNVINGDTNTLKMLVLK